MRKRPIPSSLIWLAALICLAIAAAAVGCVTIYMQARDAASTQADVITGGDWKRGKRMLALHACGTCHVIPGIAGANGEVGPDLTHIGLRVEIAGRLANTPEKMMRWLMHPQKIARGSGMPEQGITDRDARDMAAYLYARR